MNNILRYSIVFVIGLLAGMLVSLFTLNTNLMKKGDGEPSLNEVKLQTKLDSLSNEQVKSDTIIVRINNIKTKLKTIYVQDTIYITSLPFDSLKARFLSEYPRHSNHK